MNERNATHTHTHTHIHTYIFIYLSIFQPFTNKFLDNTVAVVKLLSH